MSSVDIYIPQNPVEKGYYEYLWTTANPSGDALSGKAAVQFFQRSGVDLGILKQIWTLSTPSASMNVNQFFVALRFITMYQNGEIPLTHGTFWQSCNFLWKKLILFSNIIIIIERSLEQYCESEPGSP